MECGSKGATEFCTQDFGSCVEGSEDLSLLETGKELLKT